MSKEWARQNLSREDFHLRKAVLVGENIRNEDLTPNRVAQGIRKNWNIELYASYGNS